MNAFASDRRRGPLVIVFAVICIVLIAAGSGVAYFMWPRFESVPPRVTVSPDVEVLGVAPLEIRIADDGVGLKSLKATLAQGGNEIALAAEQFDKPVGEKTLTFALAKVAGVKEGAAVLRVVARDGALFRGNETVLEKKITIDITPPTLELIADDRYVNFGGVGVVVYKVSADTATSGVKIGSHFFPGFADQVKGHADHVLALFAHPYDTAPEVRPTLVATDKAGNTKEVRLDYVLKDVRYKKSTIALSDTFLQNKVAPLLTDAAARSGTPKEVFVAVNKQLRKENEDRITAVTKQLTPSLLWSDAFAQLSNSKVEANFADLRTYTYDGVPVDTAYHLGYDLSVTKHYPVEAANSGKVAFTGDLGIYGNTVIVDHGLGLFTLYGHLSSIDVKVGDSITKRQILGKTGETGLAAGDHLHFGVYLDGVPVLPVEWWDQKWIDDNVTPKLAGRAGEEVAQVHHAAKPARKGATKKRH
jgi:murein DD-endopeptidase MepM/ murein hydrolase activator NlpD